MSEPDPRELPSAHLVDITFDATWWAVRDGLDRIGRNAHMAEAPRPLADTTRIVLAEVFNNIVEHAYACRETGKVRAVLSIGPDGVACVVRDTGAALPQGPLPGAHLPPIDAGSLDSWPEGGFGWAMIRALTQDLSYRRVAQENILSFRIALQQTDPD